MMVLNLKIRGFIIFFNGKGKVIKYIDFTLAQMPLRNGLIGRFFFQL